MYQFKFLEVKKMEIKRIKTGIPGLDELVGGGLPAGSCNLISGGPGTGKTIFGLQYLFNGAENDEAGMYLSFDRDSDLKY